ncbi:MAG TPA: signal peptidase I [Clostridiales bacterium]|jgi:signal peptidase|nr:signal peptidase I [Lachnospiraceae bacterium]HAQ40653.1 signal peptidase I [Clostridiales bacterium]
MNENMKSEEKNRRKSPVKIFLDIVTAVFFVICVALLLSSILSKYDKSIFGFRSFIVLTGSMSPTFDAGSFIIVKDKAPENIETGDIITYEISDNVILTHRVVEKNNTNGYSFITKGDANNIEDKNPVKETQIIGVAVLWINGLGSLLLSLQQPWNMILLISLILILFGLWEIIPWFVRKKDEGDKTTNT